MPFTYVLNSLWRWFATTGIALTIIVLVALLIPRIGRLVMTMATRHTESLLTSDEDKEAKKARLALLGAAIYIGEAVAYFFLTMALLKALGFSVAGAAVPATVVSAAIGFGSQKIIADFLAGFFILSEKQYGVGDWVAFYISGDTVEGSVTAITLRTTRIRTQAGEEIFIPNSAARVCVNSSSRWSRAKIQLPIPIKADQSIEHVNNAVADCVHRVVTRADMAPQVSESPTAVQIQPAVALDAPTAAGVPWCVTYRVLIDCLPAQQWAIERAVRAELVNHFWDSFNTSSIDSHSADSHSALVSEETSDDALPASQLPRDNASARRGEPTRTKLPDGVRTAATATGAQQFLTSGINPTVAASTSETSDKPVVVSDNAEHHEPSSSGDTKHSPKPKQDGDRDGDEDDESNEQTGLAKVLSLGGRCRPSTSAIIGLLVIAVIVQGLMVDSGDPDNRGILAPPPPRPAATTAPNTNSQNDSQSGSDSNKPDHHPGENGGQATNDYPSQEDSGSQAPTTGGSAGANNQQGTSTGGATHDSGSGTSSSGGDTGPQGNSGTGSGADSQSPATGGGQ